MGILILLLSQELLTIHFNEGQNLYSLQRVELNINNFLLSTNPIVDIALFPNIQAGYRFKNLVLRGGLVTFAGEGVYKSILGFDELDAGLLAITGEGVYNTKYGLVSIRYFRTSGENSFSLLYGNHYKFLLFELGYDTGYGFLLNAGVKFGLRKFLSIGLMYPGINFFVNMPVIPYINFGFIQI